MRFPPGRLCGQASLIKECEKSGEIKEIKAKQNCPLPFTVAKVLKPKKKHRHCQNQKSGHREKDRLSVDHERID